MTDENNDIDRQQPMPCIKKFNSPLAILFIILLSPSLLSSPLLGFRFFLTDHPYITSEGPHVHQVQGGSRTSYPCPIDGNPPPDFKWYSGNGTSTLINNGKNLSISEKLSKNSGWYTCQATNKLGDKIIHLHLSGKLECCLQIT